MNSFLDTLKQLGAARIALMGAVILGLILFFVFMSLRVSTPDMKLLYDDLSTVDSSAVAAKLEDSRIRFQVSPDGSRITVPATEVGRARMLLAEAGLPNGGSLGYEIFDRQSGFGTTNFVQNVNQVRALEGELARTISALERVRTARVHLVLPQREMFSRETRSASASVYLNVQAGARMENQQIVAIQSIVSSAVPGLSSANVAVIDQFGTLLARGDGDSDSGGLSGGRTEEMRLNYERTLARKIEDQVGRIVGHGSVSALVTVDLNFDRISTNEELFDPEGQVARSVQTTEESLVERAADSAGAVGIENNLPGAAGNLLVDPKPAQETSRTEEVTNFEVSRTVRITTREVGEVRRISASVLVDGRYRRDEEGQKIYEPRPQDELDRIAALVRSAIGFDAARGDTLVVDNLQFEQIEVETAGEDGRLLFGFEKDSLMRLAEGVIVLVMVVLVVLLVLQPMVNRLLAGTESRSLDNALERELLTARAGNPQLTGPAQEESFAPPQIEEEDNLIDMQRVEGKVKASSVKKVEDLIESYPTETVSVIRSWMSQET